MQKLKKILVPTDFSRPADYAVIYAADLAQITGSEIILYHSFIPFASGFYPEAHSRKENLDIEQQLKFRLSHMQDLLKKSHRKLTIRSYVDRGSFAIRVKDYCRSNNIDLVVMGTKGASALKQVMLGTYTADLIQEAPCPVIAVPAKWQFRKPGKIALAVNYEPRDLYALQILLALNTHFDAAVSIMHVHNPDQRTADPGAAAITQKELQEQAGDLPLNFKTIRSAQVLDAIIETALHEKSDLLVISPRKREETWERLFDRNLSRSAIRHIQIPVMAVPPAPQSTPQENSDQATRNTAS